MLKGIFKYLKTPVVSIGLFTGIDVEMPRWLYILMNLGIGIVVFIGMGQLFEEFFGLPFPLKL